MKVAGLIVGIFGSVAGFIGAIFALLFLGGIGAAFGAGSEVAWLGFAALIVSIVALVAAALAIAKPRFAAAVMLVSGIAGFICISAFWIPAGLLLGIGALLAFLGRKS